MSEITTIDPKAVVPIEYRILVKIGKIEEKTSGGLILPEAHRDKEIHHQVEAELINYGALAFTDSDGAPIDDRPEPGDRIIIAKYSGLAVQDKEGNLYRFANDKDVVAIVRTEREVA